MYDAYQYVNRLLGGVLLQSHFGSAGIAPLRNDLMVIVSCKKCIFFQRQEKGLGSQMMHKCLQQAKALALQIAILKQYRI